MLSMLYYRMRLGSLWRNKANCVPMKDARLICMRVRQLGVSNQKWHNVRPNAGQPRQSAESQRWALNVIEKSSIHWAVGQWSRSTHSLRVMHLTHTHNSSMLQIAGGTFSKVTQLESFTIIEQTALECALEGAVFYLFWASVQNFWGLPCFIYVT